MSDIVNTRREPVYVVGDAENYRSIYGYPKRRYRVHKLEPGEALKRNHDVHGYIKEERILDEHGNVVTTVFYEKNYWRKDGLVRFYASPEALLIACGLIPLFGRSDDVEANRKASEISQEKPADTPPIFLLGDPQPILKGLPAPSRKALPAPNRKPKAKKKTLARRSAKSKKATSRKPKNKSRRHAA